MDEIRAAATDGLQKLSRGGLDVGGVLFGVRRESGVRILTWRPIPCEHALGPTLQLSSRDRAGLTSLFETAAGDPDLRGLQPVGWFLSHTRSEVLLLPQDREIFDGFFPKPWQVTLVLRPTQVGVAHAGVFVRAPDGELKSDSSYHEFTVKPLHRASRLAEIPVPVTKERSNSRLKPDATVAAPMVASPEHGPRAPVERLLFRTLERRETGRGWLWLLPVVLGLIVAGFLVKEKYLSLPMPLSLHIYDAGEMLQVEWNQNADSVRNSHLGVIDINDGGETKRYSLADEELHSGKMSYLRHAGDLELRMTVYPAGSTPLQEFARFLDPGPPAPPPVPPEVEQLRKERDELQTQVQKLKEDLRKEQTLRRRRK